jgi:hypothetical protein
MKNKIIFLLLVSKKIINASVKFFKNACFKSVNCLELNLYSASNSFIQI